MTASAFFTAILAHLLLFCVHVNATYYCIPPIAAIQTAQPGCIPAPSGAAPFTYYTSVKACCSTDHQSVIGATSAVKTYDNVPPEALPDNCNLAVSLRNGVHECQPGETHGFLNWAPASSASSTASIDLPAICCRDDIRLLPEYASAIQVAVNIPQRGIPSPGGGIGGIPGGGIIQPTTVVPRPPIRPAPIPAGGPSQACRDLNVPGQAYSDCPAFLYRCDDPMWRSVMQQQCRFTCKLCGTGAAANGVGVARQQSPVAGNGRICRDWIGPSGHVTCAQMVSNGLCLTDRTRMRAQCRFSCGLC